MESSDSREHPHTHDLDQAAHAVAMTAYSDRSTVAGSRRLARLAGP
jgi:hypothetical protein